VRILLVTHRYPPFGLGGVERLSEQTATGLTDRGHSVTVLTRRETAAPPLPALQATERNGVQVLMISGAGPMTGRFPRGEERLELMFERTVLDVAPDVLLISHLAGHSPLYVAIAQRLGVPAVLELHDFYTACERAHLERPTGELCDGPEGGRACAEHCFEREPRARERWALRSHLYRRALEQADERVCPSDFVADYFQRTFELSARPTVVGNGVSVGDRLPRPPDSSGTLRLACVGMVAPHKGAHVIVEALRLARLPAARLTLFGGLVQPYFRELRESADEVAHLEFLAFGGFTPTELPVLLADVDAVVVPSLVWETYSIVAREAMSLGIPVIASRIGALPEAIRDHDNGLLFTPGSAQELARILRTLSYEPRRLAQLRRRIRRGDWISVAERTRRLERVLQDVIARTARRLDRFELQELRGLRDGLVEERGGA
jgi:glycosyltransferase involved in cell wall biosynthesis